MSIEFPTTVEEANERVRLIVKREKRFNRRVVTVTCGNGHHWQFFTVHDPKINDAIVRVEGQHGCPRCFPDGVDINQVLAESSKNQATYSEALALLGRKNLQRQRRKKYHAT